MTNLMIYQLSQPEKKQLLEDADWATDFNPAQIEKLANYFKSYHIVDGVPILEEGEKNNLFCVICEGAVDIIKENAAGQATVLQMLGPGKIFGELSFFDGSTCSASIVTKRETKILALHKKDFDILCAEFPNIALLITLNTIKSLSQRVRQTTGKLIDYL